MVFSQKSLDFEKNIFRRARRRHYWLRWSQRWRPQQRAQVEFFLFLISSKKRFLFQVKKVISQNVSYFQWNVECKRWRCGHHHLAPSQHCRPPPLGNNQLFWNPKSTMAPPPKLTSPWLNPGGVLNSWNSVWQQAGPAPKFKLLENSIRRSSTSPVPKGVCHILANLWSGQSHFSQKEPESYYSWISAAKDSDTNCNFTPNWPLSRFLSLIQNAHCWKSKLTTIMFTDQPALQEEEWEEARSVSRQADKFFRRRTRKVFFQLLSTTPPSVCSASSLSITLARDGWWWWSKSPQNPPRFPKKTYARRHKKNPLSIQIGRQHPLLLQLLWFKQ